MKNRTLYIIGNGFDLQHGLKSSYDDYHEYLKTNMLNVEDFINQYFIFEDKCDKKDIAYSWSNFEDNLATFKAKQFFDDHDNISEEFLNQKDPQWGDSYGVLDEVDEESEKMYLEIKQSFWNWIHEVSETKIERRGMHFAENAIFLSFNYTPTLEKVYNIPDVFHIHGNVRDHNEESLIFGHGVKNLEGEILELDEYGESNRTPWFDAEAASRSLFYKFQKPVDDIIDENKVFFDSIKCIEKVVVLGHSLNDIDMPYICKIKDSISNGSNWIIVYYHEKDKQHAKKVMKNIGVNTDLCKLLSWEKYGEGSFL